MSTIIYLDTVGLWPSLGEGFNATKYYPWRKLIRRFVFDAAPCTVCARNINGFIDIISTTL